MYLFVCSRPKTRAENLSLSLISQHACMHVTGFSFISCAFTRDVPSPYFTMLDLHFFSVHGPGSWSWSWLWLWSVYAARLLGSGLGWDLS